MPLVDEKFLIDRHYFANYCHSFEYHEFEYKVESKDPRLKLKIKFRA